MKQPTCFIIAMLATALLFMAADGWAAPSITSLTGTPTLFPPLVKTNVVFTIRVDDPNLNTNSAQLERQQTDGSWKVYSPIGLTKTSTPLEYKGSLKFNESATGRIRVRLRATFKTYLDNKYFSPVLELSVGKVVQPSNQDVTVPGPAGSGLSVTIQANSLSEPAFVGISPAPAGAITAPSPLQRVATVDVVFTPTGSSDGPHLTAPLLLSVPAPVGTPSDAHFDFVVQGLGDSPTGGMTNQLFVVDEGIVSGGQIVSNTANPVLPGFFGGGVVGVLQVQGSGYLSGRVVNGSGAGLYGVRLKDTTTNEAWYSDYDGNFIVRASVSDNYTVDAIDGFRCTKLNPALSGNLTVYIDSTDPRNNGSAQTPISGQYHKALTNPLVITGDNAGSPTRDGIRNGGFEAGVPTNCWVSPSTLQLVQRGSSPYRDSFNFASPVTVEPSEGNWMAALTSSNTTTKQTFILPALINQSPPNDLKKLRFDYIFACRTAGTCPTPSSNAIALQAEVLNAAETATLASVSPNPTFKQFNGQLGWRTAEIDVSGIAALTPVKLRFTVTGAQTDTVVLIDNVRFDTAMVIANIVSGAATTQAMVEQQIRDANVILSQAGVNLQIRRINTAVSPVNATCNSGSLDFFGTDGVDVHRVLSAPFGTTRNDRTQEIRALTCLGPNTQPNDPVSDIHVYYVNMLKEVGTTGLTPYGVAVTGEDWHGENPPALLSYNATDPFNQFNRSAILLRTLTAGSPADDPNRANETPAHEFGHLLMPNQVAGDEHLDATSNYYGNVMVDSVCNPRYGTTKCSARPILAFDLFGNRQSLSFDQPNQPTGPRCPVTCPH